MDSTIETRPTIEIEPDVLRELLTSAEESGQVIIHFRYGSHPQIPVADKIRIWKTTYLEDYDSDIKSPLLHAENITIMPEWTVVPPASYHFFTLIFKGLPKSVERFAMREYCDEEGLAFQVSNIPRNQSDVYYVVMGR